MLNKIIKILFLTILSLMFVGVFSYIVFPRQTRKVAKRVMIVAKNVIFSRRKPIASKSYKYIPKEGDIWGIDISHHQESINLERLIKNQPHFIYLKSTEGKSHKDRRYKRWRKKLKTLSIPVGSYHFFRFNVDGKQQAIHFLNYAELNTGDLRPVLDVEYQSRMPNKDKIVVNIKEFIDYIDKEKGIRPIIYCPTSFYDLYLKSSLAIDCDYWIADYSKKPSCNYVLWQCSDRYYHEAFGELIDLNLFNGTKDDFEKMLIK